MAIRLSEAAKSLTGALRSASTQGRKAAAGSQLSMWNRAAFGKAMRGEKHAAVLSLRGAGDIMTSKWLEMPPPLAMAVPVGILQVLRVPSARRTGSRK